MFYLLNYTRKPVSSILYDARLAYSMHLAISDDGEKFQALNHNSGVLFVKATENEDGSLNPKSIKNPFIFQLKEEGYGVVAVRTKADGEDDEESRGCVVLFFTKDFLEYEELGLFHLEEQYVEEVICEFEEECYIVSDDAMKRVVSVLRLAIPYSGLIVTARENPDLKRDLINHYGCTQTDASSKLGIGAYAKKLKQEENPDKVQFMLGDQRSLDEVIRELAHDGMITSFCTAGYRCGRTGDKIMNLLEKGVEGKFCKLNAVLTFREYLNDYASPETREIGEKLIAQELQEIENMPFFTDKKLLPTFRSYYDRIARGERDLYM